MRIVLVGPFPPFRGGIADLNVGLATNLTPHHQVFSVNFTTQYPSLVFPGDSQYKEDNFNLDIPSKRILSSINPFSWKKTSAYIVSLNPDLVIFRFWMPFFAPCFRSVAKKLKKKSNAKLLAICDNVKPHEARPFDVTLTKAFFKYIDRFLVLSHAVEKDLLNWIPNAKYRYTPHPYYNIFGDQLSKSEARKFLNIKSDNVILFFGLIREYKGLDILIRAIKILRNELDDFIVLVAGECYKNQEDYIQLINELGVSDYFRLNFRFVPDIELIEYFSAADVLALPYRSASQSGIVQIAYHFNLPVVVTNVGGLPEIVVDGVTGYLSEPNDISVAEALKKFFQKRLYFNFSRSVKEYKKRFSWETMRETIESLVAE